MKKFGMIVIAILTIFAFSLSASAGVIDDKCAKCHKGDKALDKIAGKSGIKDDDALLKAVRGGSKAGLHKNISDEDIKASGTELFKAGKTKKKAAEGC